MRLNQLRILSHFSESEFIFDSTRTYDQSKSRNPLKPEGLWLSDELQRDDSWTSWCVSNEFGLVRLKIENRFEIDTKDVLVLKNDRQILKFQKQWSITNRIQADLYRKIPWEEVSKKYKGIIISPYSWNLRMAENFMWYYGWDCASGCIWDLSCLRLICSAPSAFSDLSEKDKGSCPTDPLKASIDALKDLCKRNGIVIPDTNST